jgi:hypothetical protein
MDCRKAPRNLGPGWERSLGVAQGPPQLAVRAWMALAGSRHAAEVFSDRNDGPTWHFKACWLSVSRPVRLKG